MDPVTWPEVTGDLHRDFWAGGGGSQIAGPGQGVGDGEVRSAAADRPSEKCSPVRALRPGDSLLLEGQGRRAGVKKFSRW